MRHPSTIGSVLIWLLIGVVASVSLLACEKAPPTSEDGGTSVTIAREHLYPYRFDSRHTLRGTATLQAYLDAHPDGRDARMARWLLGHTFLDMLTRVITLEAEGRSDESAGLLATMARALNTRANFDEVIEAISVPLLAVKGDDPIALESLAALRLMQGLQAHDWTVIGGEAKEPTQVAVNAHLIIAARGMECRSAANNSQSTPCQRCVRDIATALLPGVSLESCLTAAPQKDCGVLQDLSGAVFEELQALRRTPETVPVITVHQGFIEELGRALRSADVKGFGARCVGN